MVDAGVPDQATTTRRGLDELGLALSDVDHLLLTHPHPDHTGGVSTLLAAGETTVYAPASARDRLETDPETFAAEARRNLVAGGFSGERLEWAVDAAVTSLTRARRLLPVDCVDVWIRPGDTVTVGSFTVDAVHTPGHQADHLCFTTDVDGERLLFSGDMVLPPFRSALIHDGFGDGHRAAVPAFLDAADRLEELAVDRVFPGHGPVHTDCHGLLARDRRSLDGRLEQTEQHADGGVTAATVVDAVRGDHDLRYMIPEVMAVLAFLEETGRVEATHDGDVTYYTRP